jgi:hypothetical protein
MYLCTATTLLVIVKRARAGLFYVVTRYITVTTRRHQCSRTEYHSPTLFSVPKSKYRKPQLATSTTVASFQLEKSPTCERMDLVSEIKKIPPVTRFLCLATVGVTGAAKLGILDLYWIFYHTDFVLQKFQV